MKIGIDFGSTYSVFSAYNSAKKCPELLTLTQGDSPSIPSVVSVTKKGKFTTGKGAKEQIGKQSVRIFEAFKMLLPTDNSKMLEKRGYDAQCTPREITRVFLDSVLRGFLERYGENNFESVVVCVPEIWSQSIHTLDGRSILRDVLTNPETGISVPVSGTVRVITEPEAASAYIAYSYEAETKKPFNGHLLLIDYGGGTLDLTLTCVSSNGEGSMEVGYREGGGEGENHPDADGEGAIGCAGIAFMQDVVIRCLTENGVEKSDLCYTSPAFMEAVRDLESQMKSPDRIRDIEDMFGQFGSYYSDFQEILSEESLEFCEIEYDGEPYSVTYQQIYSSYAQVIAPVFSAQLMSINEKVAKQIKSDPTDPKSGAKDDFKIALVGGFGSFYLVRKQMEEIYNINANDKLDLRVNSTTGNKKENAISLGAALVASERIVLQKTSRFSIGIYAPRYDGVYELHYGIKYHQNIVPGKPYYICSRNSDDSDDPRNRITYGSIKGEIDNFAIEFTERSNHGGLMRLKQEMLHLLESLPPDGYWNLGFSMDGNDIVSFHVEPSAMMGRSKMKGRVVQLGNYSKMFYLTDVKEVWSDEA